jgi:hypothetical protein
MLAVFSNLFLVVLTLMTRQAHARIRGNGDSFDSVPASFGLPWVNGTEYCANLQEIPARSLLCENDEGNSKFFNTWNGFLLPFALLVNQGGCSNEEKAREAMKLPNVGFLIVVGDKPQQKLVTMTSKDTAHNTSLRLLFVSSATGHRNFVFSSYISTDQLLLSS